MLCLNVLILSGNIVETLENKSGILYQKSKFFLYRVLTYFTFLLLPIYLQKEVNISRPVSVVVMVLYCMFIMGQWFLLGKEIDHRLKIYFRVNSSIDRIVYRLFMGMFFMTIYFNIINLLPGKWVYNIFWITWVVLGLFYSWPTRGKIIQESVSSNFHEYRYLDRFEKTILFLIVAMFVASIPEFPNLATANSLKLFFDPSERISGAFWSFLQVNYYPFKKYPDLFKIAWCVHFYFLTTSMYLMTFYAILRYFVSRRLAVLGVFALISSWSFSKILALNFGNSLLTSYSILWIWTLLWCTKSSTYRSGLFVGLVGAWGIVIDKTNIILFGMQLFALHTLFLKNKTYWYRRQFFKYNTFGVILGVLVFLLSTSTLEFKIAESFASSFVDIWSLIERKAFFILSLFGFCIFFGKVLYQKKDSTKLINLPSDKMNEFAFGVGLLFLSGLVFESRFFKDFSILWLLAFLSVIPIELIFQKIRRLRSSRNMIYMIYIIICLLDSHFEGRVKILLRMFN